MRIFLKGLQFIYSLYAFALFLILMIPVFLWSLLVLPFGAVKGGNLIYKACTVWGDAWFFLIGVHHKNICEAPVEKNKSYIFVANHISYFDIPTIVKTFRKPIRPLGKAETAKVPLFGTIYKNAIVTVDRSSPSNRARSVMLLKSFLQKGLSVLVFPEGTFNQTGNPLKEFYDGAFRIAIETGTPIKPVLFLDAFDRLHYSSIFSLTPGKSRSVFLPEVPVNGLSVNDLSHLKEEVTQIMESSLRRYRASWIKQ